MAFRDGFAPAIALTDLRFNAWATVGTWAVIPIAPTAAIKTPMTHPTLEVIVNAAAGPSSVEFQVSTVSNFASTVFTATDTLVPNGPWSHIVTPATLVDLTTYYWRVRGGNGAGVWGAWTVSTFTVDVNAGRGYGQVFLNVGIDPTATEDYGSQTVYLNGGVELAIKPSAFDYLFENVGPGVAPVPNTTEYMYWGDVSTNTPTPHIWFLDPGSGRAGDGITLVCFGVGDLAATYGGVVEYLDAGAWHTVPVVTWQTFSGTANALTAGRTIDAELGVLDPQHTNIAIVVPAGALPPGFPIRVRTNGP
jgi:hypothetical protein